MQCCDGNDSPSTRTKSRKLTEESTSQEEKTSFAEVYHGNECPSCVELNSIFKEENIEENQIGKRKLKSEWKDIFNTGDMGCSNPEKPRRSSRLQCQYEKNERVTRSSSVGLSSRQKRPGENQIDTLNNVSPIKKLTRKSVKLKTNNFKSVYHGNECPSCAALHSIKEENMARLQHHQKLCSCYSIYYRLMAFLKTIFKEVPEELKKESRFLNHNQAKELCLTASSNETCKGNSGNSILFQEASKLSDQLLGPAETASFDCDRYEKYLRLLLDIAEKILRPNRKENRKIANDVKILVEDIKDYLKPFNENTDNEKKNANNKGRNASESWSQSSKVRKWNETFTELGHSPGDEVFGKDLKEIVEPKRGEKCFFFPEHYQFKCHGQMLTKETNDQHIILNESQPVSFLI